MECTVTTSVNASGELELLTPDQLCALLQVRKSWLYDQIESGKFPCVRLGRQLRFRREDVNAYLDAQVQPSLVWSIGETLKRYHDRSGRRHR